MSNAIAERLGLFHWFNELPNAVKNELIAVSSIAHFEMGQIIGRAGEQLNYLLAISDGVVQNTQLNNERKLVVTSDHGRGSLIGWLSAIDQKPLLGTLVAKTRVEMLLIPMVIARSNLLNCQVIVNGLLVQMATLIRKHEEERRILMLPNAFQRIYLHILNLSQSMNPETEGIRLPKQDEIAVQVNTSRETVSRAIQQLLKQGIITKQGHRIQLQHPDQLKKLAEAGLEPSGNKMREIERANI